LALRASLTVRKAARLRDMPPSGSTNFLHSACVVGHVLHPTRGMQISDIIKMSFIIYPSSIDPTLK
jgi:hypothetical protein